MWTRALPLIAALGLASPVYGLGRDVQLSAETMDEITKAIQDFGYNCPQALYVLDQGEDVYGRVLQVNCGPKGGQPSSKLVFRVTLRPNGTGTVSPWR